MRSTCLLQQWRNCQERLALAQASLCDWARSASPQLRFSFTASMLNSTPTLLSAMGLVIPWSSTFLVVDAYSLLIRCLPRQRRIIWIIFLGDICLLYLSLAAACSTASVTDLLQNSGESIFPTMLCDGLRLSAAMCFLCWLLLSTSCLFNFWLLPSL